jgi:hypothetical protein
MDFKDDYQQKEEAVSVNQIQEQPVQQNSYVEDQSEQGLEEAAWAAKVQGGEKQPNKTGIPDALKAKLEQEFGFDLSKIRVHYNASIPPELNALAYAKGLDVYISKGNEKHLEHELRHVVQQMKGEAKATEIINGEKVDTRNSMEDEADADTTTDNSAPLKNLQESTPSGDIVQRQVITEEAALAKMEIVGGDFKGTSEIKIPYGNDPESTNCHGYTINQALDKWIDGDQLSSKIPADSATKIAVFVKNGKVAHSGTYDGNKLTHFLIGVGVVESTIALDGLAGYDNRYNLPDDREALESFIAEATAAAVAEAAIEERTSNVEQILGYAGDMSLESSLISSDDYQDKNKEEQLEYINANLDEINSLREGVNKEFGSEKYAKIV